MFWSRAKPSAFWKWFEANRHRAEQLIALRGKGETGGTDWRIVEPVINDIHRALSKFDKRLFLQFGPVDTGFELVISAEGDEAAFPKVFELIKAAPAIENWRFVALKPRIAGGYVKVPGIDMSSRELRFVTQASDENPSKFTILLLADAEVSDNWNEYQLLGLQTVDMLLGEQDFVRYVDDVAVVSLGKFAAQWGHNGYPIEELAEQFPASLAH